MEALQSLPGWAQFFLALVVAGILLLLNIGWLMQARGWFQAEAEKQRRRRGDVRTPAPAHPQQPATPATDVRRTPAP